MPFEGALPEGVQHAGGNVALHVLAVGAAEQDLVTFGVRLEWAMPDVVAASKRVDTRVALPFANRRERALGSPIVHLSGNVGRRLAEL